MYVLLCSGSECRVACHDRGEDLSRPYCLWVVVSKDVPRQNNDIRVLPFREIAPLSRKA
jgi:hypothetical protein